MDEEDLLSHNPAMPPGPTPMLAEPGPMPPQPCPPGLQPTIDQVVALMKEVASRYGGPAAFGVPMAGPPVAQAGSLPQLFVEALKVGGQRGLFDLDATRVATTDPVGINEHLYGPLCDVLRKVLYPTGTGVPAQWLGTVTDEEQVYRTVASLRLNQVDPVLFSLTQGPMLERLARERELERETQSRAAGVGTSAGASRVAGVGSATGSGVAGGAGVAADGGGTTRTGGATGAASDAGAVAGAASASAAGTLPADDAAAEDTDASDRGSRSCTPRLQIAEPGV